MNRNFIYIIVVIATIGFVFGEDYLRKDLENVGDDILNLDTGKMIEEVPVDYKELKDSEAIRTTLEIKNKENDTNKTVYNYVLHIDDIKGSYKTKKGNKEYYTIFDATGTAKIELLANESIMIYDVPLGSPFTLEQLENKDYITKVNDKDVLKVEGTLFTENKVTFENINKTAKQYTPNTVDNIKVSIIILMISITTYLILSKIKIKKFENI